MTRSSAAQAARTASAERAGSRAAAAKTRALAWTGPITRRLGLASAARARERDALLVVDEAYNRTACRTRFTLHAPDGTRILGFDNAHQVLARGSRFKPRQRRADHWHRTENDPGRPYAFRDAETLIDDFFDEVGRVLGGRGVGTTVVRVEEKRRQR